MAFPWQTSRSKTQAQRWHGGHNATGRYRELIDDVVTDGMSILHAGCGWDRTNISGKFKERCRVVGVDMDPRVADMYHSEFHLGTITEIPFEDDTFDVVLSEYVFEHLTEPDSAFKEIARVLKPGGHFFVLTPNLYSYKSIAARFSPHFFHVWMGRIRYGRGKEDDMYPTYFRCNTTSKLASSARSQGFEVDAMEIVTNGPTWFEKIPVAYFCFDKFHRAIERVGSLEQLRCGIVANFKKLPRQSQEKPEELKRDSA